MSELASALIGALVAFFGTIAWESFLKPHRERRRLAKVLRVDVADNRQALVSVLEFKAAGVESIPLDFQVGTATLDALMSGVGDLDVETTIAVVAFYNRLRYLSALGDEYRSTVLLEVQAESESPLRSFYEERLRNIRVAFFDAASVALQYGHTAFDRLNELSGEPVEASAQQVTAYEQRRQAALLRTQGHPRGNDVRPSEPPAP